MRCRLPADLRSRTVQNFGFEYQPTDLIDRGGIRTTYLCSSAFVIVRLLFLRREPADHGSKAHGACDNKAGIRQTEDEVVGPERVPTQHSGAHVDAGCQGGAVDD